MTDVKIVCDASFDDKLRLTGYAGGIYITESNVVTATHLYQGVAGELRNIQEGEFTAILVGLRELSKVVNYAGVSVENIEVYSDSKNSVETLEHWRDIDGRKQGDYHINQLMGHVREICQKLDLSPQFKHVSSHVPTAQASGIERLNNMADARATAVRKEAINLMLNPRIQKSLHIAVLLPGSVRDKTESTAMENLAYELASQGHHFRLYIDKTTGNHPFQKGIMQYCMEKHRSPVSIAKVYNYSAQATHYGLDMTMYRHHMQQQGRDPRFDLSHNPIEVRAALASRLLYGELTPEWSDMERPTGRLYPPSCVVYDLMDPLPKGAKLKPHSVQGWVSTYLEYVDTPKVEGLRAAYEHSGVLLPPSEVCHIAQRQVSKGVPSVRDSTIVKLEDRLRTALRTVYSDYKGQLEPAQFSQKVVSELIDCGFPTNEMFKTGMARFIQANEKKDVDVFVGRVIRQAGKMTPPDWIKPQSKSGEDLLVTNKEQSNRSGIPRP
jgi:ribonuclease HI